MPTVSVIIPAYNAENYILETIESILTQSYKDFEIIVVDDKSTDNTKNIVMQIASDKIRYFCLDENHSGPSRPRNIGIKLALGKYIAFCDSDDLYTPNRLKSAVNFLESNGDLGMIFTDEQQFDDKTGKELGNFLHGYNLFHSLSKKKINENLYIIKSEDAFNCLFYENYILTCGVTCRRSIFTKIGYFDESLTNGDDRDMWFRITRKFSIGFIDDIGFRYRVREGSISGRGPELAVNRSKVIQKQINEGLPLRLQNRCRQIIAANTYGIGYYYQKEGKMSDARKYYIDSIKKKINLLAIKGLFITFLGRKIYFWLKKKVNEIKGRLRINPNVAKNLK